MELNRVTRGFYSIGYTSIRFNENDYPVMIYIRDRALRYLSGNYCTCLDNSQRNYHLGGTKMPYKQCVSALNCYGVDRVCYSPGFKVGLQIHFFWNLSSQLFLFFVEIATSCRPALHSLVWHDWSIINLHELPLAVRHHNNGTTMQWNITKLITVIGQRSLVYLIGHSI